MDNLVEIGKKNSAYKAIDDFIDKNVKIMGVGSGSTIVYAIERLAEKVKNDKLNIQFIPTSFQSRQLLIKHNLPITDLEMINQSIDVTIDGADEVNSELDCIKGGGGCQLQEKIIAYAAKKFIVIADGRKKSDHFGQNWKNGIPIEVIPMAYKLVMTTIENEYAGKVILRESNAARTKAGPVITDNGNFILDWVFDDSKSDYDWKKIDSFIKMIPGVVESGLFIQMASAVYFGMSDGTVEIIQTK